jgi:hypothetical protein
LFPQLLIGHSRSPAMKLCALSTLYDSENGIFAGTGHVAPQKPWLEPVLWAREELNLRSLPCQIQRAATGMYVGGAIDREGE